MYVKIGKLVVCHFRLNQRIASGSGSLKIKNLPFSPSVADRAVMNCGVTFSPAWGNNAPSWGFMASTTEILLKQADSDNAKDARDTSISIVDVANSTHSCGLIAVVTYQAS